MFFVTGSVPLLRRCARSRPHPEHCLEKPFEVDGMRAFVEPDDVLQRGEPELLLSTSRAGWWVHMKGPSAGRRVTTRRACRVADVLRNEASRASGE